MLMGEHFVTLGMYMLCAYRGEIMFRRKPNKVPQDYKIIAFKLTEVLYLYSFKILNYVV